MSKPKALKPISEFAISILKEYADKFQQWLACPRRRDALCSLVKLISEANFQRALGWLERNKTSMFGPLKRAYNNILSDVQFIYRTKEIRFALPVPNRLRPVGKTNPIWLAKWDDKNVPQLRSGEYDFQELKEHVMLFVDLLKDTARDLQKSKEPTNDLTGEHKKEERIVLTQPQQKILKYLKKINTAVAQVDIETETGLSNKTVSAELRGIKGYNFAAPPKGKKRRIVITQKGVDYLNSLT